MTSPLLGPSVWPMERFPPGDDASSSAVGATSSAVMKWPKGNSAYFSAHYSSLKSPSNGVAIGPGGNGIDQDVVGGKIARHRLGQAENARLGRGVGGPARGHH
jgi:hypothetical protein